MQSADDINLDAEEVLRKLKKASDDLHRTIQQSKEILRSLPATLGPAAQEPPPDGSAQRRPPAG